MSVIKSVTEKTVTVVVPVEFRRRNGRPKIVLPDDGSDSRDAATDKAGTTVLRAIARAWHWRRRLEAGEVGTLQDIADAEKITVSFVSRFIRLAYLSPAVLDRIVVARQSVAVSLEELAAAARDPWAEQPAQVLMTKKSGTVSSRDPSASHCSRALAFAAKARSADYVRTAEAAEAPSALSLGGTARTS